METTRQLTAAVSVLMPVCNEAAIIGEVVEEWVRDVFQYLPPGSEFLFDEAGSTDGTKEILERLSQKYPFIHVTYNESKDGFAAAARRLYMEAKCPLIFFTDSDGQYIASDFWKLARFVPAYDFVHGVKIGRKDPWLRRLFSAIFNKLVGFLFEIHYADLNCAFHFIKTDVAKKILPQVVSMPTLINTELLLRTELENYEIKQVYILHRSRKFGRSRGLPPLSYLWEGIKAFCGLWDIKASYRS